MAEQRKVDTGIIQRGKSYRFTFALGIDPITKKQRRKTETWIPPEGITQKKADKLAKERYFQLKKEYSQNTSFDDTMLFKELGEKYFEIFAPNELKPVTEYCYRHCYDLHFLPYFGNKKLRDITTTLLSSYFNSLVSVQKGKDGKPKQMKPTTVKRIFNCMQSIMTFAVDSKILTTSPCQKVILPKGAYSEAREHPARSY